MTFDLLQCSDQTLHPLQSVAGETQVQSGYGVFNRALLHTFQSYLDRQMSFDSFLAVAYIKLEQYADTLIQDVYKRQTLVLFQLQPGFRILTPWLPRGL